MRLILLLGIALFWACSSVSDSDTQSLQLPGLRQPVEILRDRWGVAHIYAQNEQDLFFAQGYTAASDRLFQLELWRRQATGTTAEWLGPKHLKRDIGTRLFRFRGDLEAEMKHYHPHGPQIIRAFVAGINAYIRQINQTPDQLPPEFKLLNTKPGYWTPEVVLSRHQGLLENVREELKHGRLVHLIGADSLRKLSWFHPVANNKEPDLTLHVAGDQLFQPILELYEAFRLPLKFSKDDKGLGATEEEAANWLDAERKYTGSNNWVVSGSRSASGYPMLANDPHRAQAIPSLRYWTHLHAPGWNVIGAGEPSLPGVSIGHNEAGAWGLTIFETDTEDLYVYETNPANPDQYRYRGKWEAVKLISDTIPVKGQQAVPVKLKYTRHGPVVYEDAKNHKLYAVRAGWLQPGCAPYLASLRMNVARNWEEFRSACLLSRIPGENMVWAGRPSAGRPSAGRPSGGQSSTKNAKGDIGWQVVALSPIRKNWSGLVPVPGDGRFEWAGFLPIAQLPHQLNPPAGFITTANNNLLPPNYPHRNAVGWDWASPVRAQRIAEVLKAKSKHNLTDFKKLQTDYVSLYARTLVPLLAPLQGPSEPVEWARQQLLTWDFQLHPTSIPAAVYDAWQTRLWSAVYQATVPEKLWPYLTSLPSQKMFEWVTTPAGSPLGDLDRDQLLLDCLEAAVADLTQRLGYDRTHWWYGQPANKHIQLTHPLSGLMSPQQASDYAIGPVARGGNAETVNTTGSQMNQNFGASFRILVDTQDWDKTLGINNPGQSADPASPHYKDLFPLWSNNEYFPVYFSKEKIRTVTEKRIVLKP